MWSKSKENCKNYVLNFDWTRVFSNPVYKTNQLISDFYYKAFIFDGKMYNDNLTLFNDI